MKNGIRNKKNKELTFENIYMAMQIAKRGKLTNTLVLGSAPPRCIEGHKVGYDKDKKCIWCGKPKSKLEVK